MFNDFPIRTWDDDQDLRDEVKIVETSQQLKIFEECLVLWKLEDWGMLAYMLYADINMMT